MRNLYYLVSEVAKHLPYHVDYLTQLCRSRSLSCLHISKHWFVSRSSLQNFLNNSEKFSGLFTDLNEKVYEFQIYEDVAGNKIFFIDNEEYLDTESASKISSYSKDYITQLARKGEIYSFKYGKFRLVSKSDLLQYLKYRKTGYKADKIKISRINYIADQQEEFLPNLIKKHKKNEHIATNAQQIHNSISVSELKDDRVEQKQKIVIASPVATQSKSVNSSKKEFEIKNKEQQPSGVFAVTIKPQKDFLSKTIVLDLSAQIHKRKAGFVSDQKQVRNCNNNTEKMLIFLITALNTLLFVYIFSLSFLLIEAPKIHYTF